MKLTLVLIAILFAKPALIIALSPTKHEQNSTKISRAQKLEEHIAHLFKRHEVLTEIHLSVGRNGIYPIAGVDKQLNQIKELYRQAVALLEEMENIEHGQWSALERKFLSLNHLISKEQKKIVQGLSQNSVLVSLYRI